MSISDERIEQIMSFIDEVDLDCPPLTDQQLAQMKPSHLVNREVVQSNGGTLNLQGQLVQLVGETYRMGS